MMNLRDYSYNKVGDVWTEQDHTFLVSQLGKADKLAQDAHNALGQRAAAGKVTALFPLRKEAVWP